MTMYSTRKYSALYDQEESSSLACGASHLSFKSMDDAKHMSLNFLAREGRENILFINGNKAGILS